MTQNQKWSSPSTAHNSAHHPGKKNLEAHNVQVRYTALRNPQANPSERCMREISKFFQIYCSENHRKWVELIPHIQSWLNNTIPSATGLTPAELIYRGNGPNIFKEFLPEEPSEEPESRDVQAKTAKAYEKMMRKLNTQNKMKRKGQAHWTPKERDKVLMRTQPVSDATASINAKFLHPYKGPYVIAKVITPSTFEVVDENGRIRGQFNKRLLKAYKEAAKTGE
jgi:hypothetical protein